MLGAFFDDSGTHSSSEVVAIGGLLGTEAQWDEFAQRWTALLKRPLPRKPPLKQFHLSPCRNGEGEFASYSEAERDHITYLFRQVILDVGMVTIAAAIDKVAWNEIVTGEMVEQLGNPLEGLFVKAVDSMVDIIRARKPHEQVYIFFDLGLKQQYEVWAQLYLMQKDRYPEISGFSFAPVPNVVALQGADMIAYETYRFAIDWFKIGESAPFSPHFASFKYRDLSAGVVFGREQIQEVVRLVKERKASQ